VYLQSEEHVRSTLSELTNGVYDKHCSKQKPSTVYYCQNLTVENILYGRLWLDHTTKTANMKKALLLSSTSPFSQCTS